MPRLFCVVVATLVAALPSVLAAAQAADPPRRPESQQEYWAQVDRKDWSAAIAAGEQLVAAARARTPQEPLALAEALSLLGNAQFGAKDYIAAEKAFVESLQTVEQHAGGASAKLLDPLRGLGYTLAAAGRHNEAVPPLERAVLIDRRSHGLYDIGQQTMLRQLAESLSKLGRADEAERHVMYLLQLAERVYGRRDPRQVPILCFVAGWRADAGDFVGARAIYRHALATRGTEVGPERIRPRSSRCAHWPKPTRRRCTTRRSESRRRACSGCPPTRMAPATSRSRSTRGTWATKARMCWSAP